MYCVAYSRKYLFTIYTLHFFTTSLDVIVVATLGKSSHSKWYLNETMDSGSFAPRKVKNCKQHDVFLLSLYIYIYNVAIHKTIKRTELTAVKLPLSFERHDLLNIISWVGRS